MSTFSNWLENKDNELFLSVTEGKKKDVTGDGKADFADVMASRMIASGMSKEKAIEKASKHAGKSK